MKKDNPFENRKEKPRGRLDHPALHLASILVAILAIFTLLYSLASSLPIIPVLTGIFLLMLWFIPQIWKWIEFVFSKQPSSIWGRFILNLVLAIIMASTFEDILELIVQIARIFYWALERLL